MSMEKTKRCTICRHEMVATTVEHPYWHDNTLIALVHGVPSWVCQAVRASLF